MTEEDLNKAAADTANTGPYEERMKRIEGTISDLYRVFEDINNAPANVKTDDLMKEAAPVIVGNVLNLAYYTITALTEIAQAQQTVAALALTAYEESKSDKEPINPSERSFVGKKRGPFTPPA